MMHAPFFDELNDEDIVKCVEDETLLSVVLVVSMEVE